MKNKIYILLSFFTILVLNSFSQDIYNNIGDQLIKKDNILNGRFPIYTVNGKWIFSETINWFAGFTAGELWNLFAMTGNEEFKIRALRHTEQMLRYTSLDNTHDLGFIFLNSCVKAYKYTKEKKYRAAAIEAARTLAKRFNKKGNFIRAWGKLSSKDSEGLMIIDTMMNLELLFWAAQETGDYSLYDIAYKHAIICMNQNIRSDFSAYHVVEFNPETGEVLKKKTHQGYSDESTWSRGQAWGIYGFAIAYQYTNDIRFLNVSKNLANFLVKNLPNDFIPYWDLNLKSDTSKRDASAAAIAASGLFLISELTDDKSDYIKYLSYAKNITESLQKNYLFTKSRRDVEEGILIHTVYHHNKGYGVDESYPAGDYYFTECVKKLYDYNKKENIILDNTERESHLINDNWYYLEDDISNYEKLYLTSKKWQKINLPHTWNKTDALDEEPGYRRSVSWYQKEIFFPLVKNHKIFKIHFEGVNNKAEVYVNDHLVSKHIGGYVGFDVDISSYIKKGEKNLVTVKADNSFDINVIPSQKSDFINYGGITRNVWLNIVPKTYIKKIFVKTPEVSSKKATTKIELLLQIFENAKKEIKGYIKDNRGKIITEKKIKTEFKMGKQKMDFEFPEVKNPNLWSPNSPYLYSVEFEILNGAEVIDRLSDRFGYRWFEFKDHGAFFLNGERLLLRGTHRHEELSEYGNALTDSLHRKDIILIKEMGANFIRLAHYPQAPEIYRACDELGLLVWDENPWCRGGMGTSIWQENTKNIFKEMIIQNYNHPSIIMWSIGNESDWLPDFPNGDIPDSLTNFAKVLHNLAKELDPYRYSSTRKFPAAQAVVDVFSPSIWSGWYSDVYKNYEKAINRASKAYKKTFFAEYGGDSHVGRHTDTPIDGEGKITTSGGDEPINKIKNSSIANIGDWSESYIVDLFDWYLHISENLDWFPGSAQWIFRDFTTPLRPENPIPYVNQKGLVDMNNNPKDAYYVFKSYWTVHPKFCYIESHTWEERNGNPGKKQEVNVFSNCSEVELYLNGNNLGKLKKDLRSYPASGLSWKLDFIEGENVVKSKGYDAGKVITEDSLNIKFTYKKNGKPDNLILEKSRYNDGNYLITSYAVDKDGNHCLDFDGRVYFSAISGGKLLNLSGTPIGSNIIEMANGKASILFKYIPFERGIIEVRSQDFKGTYLTIEE